jgi:hypothetical protein
MTFFAYLISFAMFMALQPLFQLVIKFLADRCGVVVLKKASCGSSYWGIFFSAFISVTLALYLSTLSFGWLGAEKSPAILTSFYLLLWFAKNHQLKKLGHPRIHTIAIGLGLLIACYSFFNSGTTIQMPSDVLGTISILTGLTLLIIGIFIGLISKELKIRHLIPRIR